MKEENCINYKVDSGTGCDYCFETLIRRTRKAPCTLSLYDGCDHYEEK